MEYIITALNKNTKWKKYF